MLSKDEMASLMRQLKADDAALSLPLPKRYRMDPVRKLRELVMDDGLRYAIKRLLEQKMTGDQIVEFVFHSPLFEKHLRETHFNKTSFSINVLCERFFNNKGHLFTLRDSFLKRLEDFEIGKEIPVSFLKPPYDLCYFEFGFPENRKETPYRMFGVGSNELLEGVYVAEFIADKGAGESHVLDQLNIDPSEPFRILELSFSGSPVKTEKGDQSLSSDLCDYVVLYIQDEEESLLDCLERHFKYYLGRKELSAESIMDLEKTEASTQANLLLLVKTLLYLTVSEQKSVLHDKEESDLLKRLEKTQNKGKARKIAQRAAKLYDRVIVGPNKPYIPLKDYIEKIGGSRKVKPHYRRGFYGIRLSGKKRGIRKLTFVRPTIVNKDQLDGPEIDLKEYIIG